MQTEPKSCIDFHTNICKMNRATQSIVIRKRIMNEICQVFMVNEYEIQSDARIKTYVIPRMFYAMLCKELVGASLHSIANDLGGRDHTTIMNSHKSGNNLLQHDSKVKQAYKLIRNKIKKNKEYEQETARELVAHLFRDATSFDKRERWQVYTPSYKVRKRIENMLKQKNTEDRIAKKTKKEIIDEYEHQFLIEESATIHLPDPNFSYRSRHS